MRRSVSVVTWTMVLLAMIVMATPPAYGQAGGVSSSLSGLVVDTSGGVMPGVDIVVRNNATAGISQTVTDAGGRFTVPALQPGTYTVTISLTGFKTVVLPDVQVVAATPASVKAVLELGKIEESVVVTGATEIVQTQTASVQSTINVQQISQLPLVTRTALDYVIHAPGVTTAGSDSRGSTINGLPTVTINITLDGVNVQDNNNRNGDGFFMYIRPLMDSVEEITVSTSTPGAESAGQGASQIRMVTRSGSNRFSGSVYNTWRNQAGVNDNDVATRNKKSKWLWGLNTPYWFNMRDRDKTPAGEYFIDDMRLQTPGVRVGGPVLKDKLFYFFNIEWFLWPNQFARTRYLLNENARQGLFSYPATDNSGTKTVNLYAIAAANGEVATPDPTVAKLLLDIRNSTTDAGMGRENPYDVNVNRIAYNPTGDQYRYFPTLRLDFNITNAHRLSFSTRYNRFESTPDMLNNAEARWPGFPNAGWQVSDRYTWQATLRSTIGKSMVNEARIGWMGAFGKGTEFYTDVNEAMFNCTGVGCQSVNGIGYSIGIGGAASDITSATTTTGPSARLSPSWVYEDALTWLKGKHSFSMGASYSTFYTKNWFDTIVPTITLGTASRDTRAYNMLGATSGNYPGGITNTWAGYARDLYGVLTGRVTNISGSAVLAPDGKYYLDGEATNQIAMDELGLYISDSWRLRPNLTLNAGIRYELQLPFKTDGITYARLTDWRMVYGITGAGDGSIGQGNLFKPGTMTGANPVLEQYPKSASGYNTDFNNLAPSVGAAWRPTLTPSFLTKILSTDPVIRGGYSVSYSRQGFASFVHDDNPGATRTASRSTTTGCNGNCLIGADGFPVLLQQTTRLFQGTFPAAPSYPSTPATNETVYSMYPDIVVPYTHQWSAGFQRELGKTMAVEVRYVGNRNVGQWTTWGMNSSANWNILENGFYQEFQNAQKNLLANVSSGRCQPGQTSSSCRNNFAYMGPGTGTYPLPIFMAYFAGIPLTDARNTDPALYTSSNFRSDSWYNSLRMYDASITGISGTGSSGLQNADYANNAKAAGLPANFFMANPAVYQANGTMTINGGNQQYHSLQIDFRRRMAQGFMLQVAFMQTLSRKTYTWRSLRESPITIDSTGGPAQSLKFNWIWELPFGRGRAFGSGASRWLDAVIGGWEIDGVARFTSGSRFNYGGYRLVGMTEKDLQQMFKYYKRPDANGKTRIYMLPDDVIQNSMLALYTASATTTTGYAGTLPTGRYLAPADGPDCVQYLSAQCSGTTLTRIITGPMYGKLDMSFVKRIAVFKNMRVEARMDLYNITNAINFNATDNTGDSLSGWEVTSAARDPNASQDAGGRITSFGLRFTW